LSPPVETHEAGLRACLNEDLHRVTQAMGTERPFTGALLHNEQE